MHCNGEHFTYSAIHIVNNEFNFILFVFTLSELFFSLKLGENVSRDMKFTTMWYVQPAKPHISLRISEPKMLVTDSD